jgi:hypothetical protein
MGHCANVETRPDRPRNICKGVIFDSYESYQSCLVQSCKHVKRLLVGLMIHQDERAASSNVRRKTSRKIVLLVPHYRYIKLFLMIHLNRPIKSPDILSEHAFLHLIFPFLPQCLTRTRTYCLVVIPHPRAPCDNPNQSIFIILLKFANPFMLF